MPRSAAVLGASGYAGGELVRLLDAHPDLEIAHFGAHTKAGRSLSEVHPQLAGGDRLLATNDPGAVPDVDVAFLAVPHGQSAEPAKALHDRGMRVVDLGADHRFAEPAAYEAAYGSPHPHPGDLADWVYGIPELAGDRVAAATRVAAPGCYPTSALLALAPLLRAGVVEPHAHVVSMSGVTGAGRSVREDLTFGAVAEGVRPYGVLRHRHEPEMIAGLAGFAAAVDRLHFVPHLVPIQRGLLSTCLTRAKPGVTAADLRGAYDTAYEKAPFVAVLDQPPQTRWVVGSNNCLVAVALAADGTVAAMAAIDNLLKGAAGQAVQCANLMLGLAETAGLPTAGLLP